MKNYFFIFSVFCILFVDTNLAYPLGLGDNRTTAAYLPFVCLIIIEILKEKFNYAVFTRWLLGIIVFGVIAYLLKDSIGQGDVFKRYLTFFIIPFIIAGYLENITYKQKHLLQNIIFAFLIIEVLMALYERITLSVILADESAYQAMSANQIWTFRASALLGHPLGNAMAISVINIFILCSRLSANKKLLWFCFSLMGLFCFNERGNIVITFLTALPLLYTTYKKLPEIKQKQVLFLIIPTFIITVCWLSTSDFGGRLFNVDHSQDGSSLARLSAFSVFSHLGAENIYLGDSNNYNYLLNKTGMAGIENGFIAMLLYHGIIIGSIALILLIGFQIDRLRIYPTTQKWIIMILFCGIGMTNPHISNPYQWMVFICAYYAFRPYSQKKKNAI